MTLTPITPESMLEDLCEAQQITSLRLPPTSPKFAMMLVDKDFAERAQAIVTDRIALLKESDIGFGDSSGRYHSLKAWQSLLAKIEDSLYQGAPTR